MTRGMDGVNERNSSSNQSVISENNSVHQNSNHSEFKKRNRISAYVSALRPWSFSASMVPVILGTALAYKSSGTINICTLIITLLTAISVHAAGNVVNTYYDYLKGIDSKKSDDRTLVDNILTPDEIVQLGAIIYGTGCVGFILLAIMSPAKIEHLALVYFGGLSSSFLYTGGIGLKYIALGDVLILITFGPLTVLFSYMAQCGHLDPVTLLYAAPIALNTEAILHSNNTRDMESDKKAGVVTLAILIGRTASHVLYVLLLFTPYVMFSVIGIHFSKWLLLPLITLPAAFDLEKQFRRDCLAELPNKTAKLNLYFGLFYVISCMICNSNHLPWLQRS